MSFVCLPLQQPFRRFCRWLVEARLPGTPLTLTTAVLLLVTLASCGAALESCDFAASYGDVPLALSLIKMSHRLDLLVVVLSAVELVAKMIAFGAYFTPTGYFRDGWNQLDASLVALTLLNLWVGHAAGDLLTLRALRLLRLFLYELRFIVRFSGVRQVVALLVIVMPRAFNIMLVYVLFVLVFGILGVQLFAGRFAACSFDVSLDRTECVAKGGADAWQSPTGASFDNIGSACLLLFEMSSLEGWPAFMYAGIDAAALTDQPPSLDRNPVLAIYFVAWVLAGGMVLINLFVGVLVVTFTAQNEQQSGASKLMDAQQQQWASSFELMLQMSPQRSPPCPKNCLRALCWRLIHWAPLETFILLVILLNTVLMGMDGYNIAQAWLNIAKINPLPPRPHRHLG